MALQCPSYVMTHKYNNRIITLDSWPQIDKKFKGLLKVFKRKKTTMVQIAEEERSDHPSRQS